VNEHAGKSNRLPRRITFGACAVLAFCGYVTGWPAWSTLLLLSAVPAVSFCVWMWTGRLRRYRFLFAIYGIAALAAGYEAWLYRAIPESVAESIDLPAGPGEPDLFLEGNLVGVMVDLYPHRAESLFVRGFQVKLCNDGNDAHRHDSICEQFRDSDLATVRKYFEQALALGTKTDENLYYHYVEILIRQDAPQDEIDAAAAEWKRLFPLSERIDPREAFARAGADSPPAIQQQRRPVDR